MLAYRLSSCQKVKQSLDTWDLELMGLSLRLFRFGRLQGGGLACSFP